MSKADYNLSSEQELSIKLKCAICEKYVTLGDVEKHTFSECDKHKRKIFSLLLDPSKDVTDDHFESLTNFRELGDYKARGQDGKFYPMKKHMVSRSATPATGSEHDIKILKQVLGIKTLVDLRADSEFLPNEHVTPFKKLYAPPSILRRPIYGYEFMFKGVLGKTSFSAKVNAVKYFLSRRTDLAKKEIIGHLNTDGLFGLYVLFLTYCGNRLGRALDLFLKPELYPIHIFCNAGKDRTGLLTTLLLASLGVSEEDICDEYAKTQYADFGRHKAFESSLVKAGLISEFMEAPREVMVRTLEYLKTRYGSIDNYLEEIGFRLEKRMRLRRLLLDEQSVEWTNPSLNYIFYWQVLGNPVWR
eukprot:TRINITY_DN9478_c0_g1_i1.p1 TRINITY_DN9478_c0_g1~~TRINITY_DN9478_c0_g1_i1.p1  ORF type:complete len:359 (-),score=66.17 TRINITY_DN9478_c0_g1_i1:22-1098(-)